MTDILLALCLAAALALGRLAMKRLDRFLERNRAAIERRTWEEPANLTEEVDGARERRVRELPPVGEWRGGNLFPLRHRS